jgi:hypothetical protein
MGGTSRSRSQSKNRPRRSGGGRGGEKEIESARFEVLKRRVEKVIGRCCGGVYEWVVLEVIKESACPSLLRTERRGEDDDNNTPTSTPTPTIANASMSEENDLPEGEFTMLVIGKH